jgi:hypothetical protein
MSIGNQWGQRTFSTTIPLWRRLSTRRADPARRVATILEIDTQTAKTPLEGGAVTGTKAEVS